MSRLIINGLIIFIIAVILFFPVTADISFDSEADFKVTARLYWFIKLKLYPRPPKKEKKQKKDEIKAEQAAEPPQKKEKKYDAMQLLDVADELLPQAIKMLSVLRRTFFISRLYLRLKVADEDAAETAIKYGEASALVWALAGMIKTNFNTTSKPDIIITPDFNTQNQSLAFKARINICLFAAAIILLFFAAKAVIIVLKDKASDNSAGTDINMKHAAVKKK